MLMADLDERRCRLNESLIAAILFSVLQASDADRDAGILQAADDKSPELTE